MRYKIINHIRRWNIWRKYSLNSCRYKLLVLLGIVKSPTFKFAILPEDADKLEQMFLYGGGASFKDTAEDEYYIVGGHIGNDI